jgi:Cu2+-exporting ATPase
MKEAYRINGMSCNKCVTHVEQALRKVEGVNGVTVNLQKAEAEVDMPSHIPIEKFQEALKNSGYNYTISFLEHSLLNTDDVQKS